MYKYITSLLLFVLLVGCSQQASLEPVAIDEVGVDSCAECHMGIQDLDHASQIILEDGTPKIYDDIGCMLIDYDEQKGKLGVMYVRDYHTKEWIDFKEATFVQYNNIPTPMSYGIIAFQSREDAEQFQGANRGGGQIFEGEEIFQLDVHSLKENMDHDHGEHHHDEMSEGHE